MGPLLTILNIGEAKPAKNFVHSVIPCFLVRYEQKESVPHGIKRTGTEATTSVR